MAVDTRPKNKKRVRPRRVIKKAKPAPPKKKKPDANKRPRFAIKVTRKKLVKRAKPVPPKKKKPSAKKRVRFAIKVTQKKLVVPPKKKKPVTKKKLRPNETCRGGGFKFNARGDDASCFKSCPKSRGPAFCDIPYDVMQDLGDMLNASTEMEDMIENNPKLSFCMIIDKMLPASCMRGWRLTRFLGRGIAGYVFASRHCKTRAAGALKIQVSGDRQTTMSHSREVSTHKKFTSAQLSPKIHAYCSTRKFGGTIFFLNMTRIDTVLDEWLRTRRSKNVIDQLVDRLFEMIRVMDKKGYAHGDLHGANIGFVYKRRGAPGRIQILDHGFATTKTSLPEIEVVQFLRTLDKRYSRRVHEPTAKYLRDRFVAEARRIYGFKISKNINSLEKEFSRLRKKLRGMIRNAK